MKIFPKYIALKIIVHDLLVDFGKFFFNWGVLIMEMVRFMNFTRHKSYKLRFMPSRNEKRKFSRSCVSLLITDINKTA